MNKIEILEKAKSHILKSEKVFISDWECDVVVRQLSGKQYLDISNDCLNGKDIDRKKFLNLAIINSVFDINGEQIFDNSNYDLLENMSADAYSALILVVTKLNNLDGNTPKNLKKVN